MNVQEVLKQADLYFTRKEGPKAEALLRESLVLAMDESDDAAVLTLLNELTGYYRETSRVEESYMLAEQAMALAERMGLAGTLPYANTLLNAANAFRAGGDLTASLSCYGRVKEIYLERLQPEDMLQAALHNNISLLYQELGDFASARENLLEALRIVEANPEARFEKAVTLANLAAACGELGEDGEAESCAVGSIELFERYGIEDAHYGAALSALGACYYKKGELERAAAVYRRAMEEMRRCFGENEYYRRLRANLEACEAAVRGRAECKAGDAGTHGGCGASERSVKPGDPESPVEPAEPGDPESPVASVEPGDPESPVEPAEPGDPESPVEPAEPGVPKSPVTSVGPGVPESPVASVGLGVPEGPVKPVKPIGPGTPGNGGITARQVAEGKTLEKGLDLCRAYYEKYGKPMLEERFPECFGRIAVGLVGEGSDCFGFDDELSRDHDFGPGFCLWMSKETYAEIGREVETAYEALPREFEGLVWQPGPQARKRRGVFTVRDFYLGLLGADCREQIDWTAVRDEALAAAVNGEVFHDGEGLFTADRRELLKGYPESVQYRKLAQSAALFSQSGQYNYARMMRRGDAAAALIMLGECAGEALKLCYYMENKYPPHSKWLCRGLEEWPCYAEIRELTGRLGENPGDAERTAQTVERLGDLLARALYGAGFISDTDSYLDRHVPELLQKSFYAEKTDKELAEEITRAEFEAFDKVKNAGGRADCQNDWETFSIMRLSQYLTWDRSMLLQYLYDFKREYRLGHNLIEEKYGRMMESTAPEEYERIRGFFPEIGEQKAAVIEAVTALQVEWMEAFAQKYPGLAGKARSIRTREDTPVNTSYETYLRGELGTYSDKMLELYGRFVARLAGEGRNPACEIMENSVRMYGYGSLEEAERNGFS